MSGWTLAIPYSDRSLVTPGGGPSSIGALFRYERQAMSDE